VVRTNKNRNHPKKIALRIEKPASAMIKMRVVRVIKTNCWL